MAEETVIGPKALLPPVILPALVWPVIYTLYMMLLLGRLGLFCLLSFTGKSGIETAVLGKNFVCCVDSVNRLDI